jgi:hypothetical protein
MWEAMNITNQIIAYEVGELNDRESIELFSELIRSGMAWTLQGHYGRSAVSLIEEGYIAKDGEILYEFEEEEEEIMCDYCDANRVEKQGQFCSKDCSGGFWNDMNADKDDY